MPSGLLLPETIMNMIQKTILSLVATTSLLVAVPNYSLGTQQQPLPDDSQQSPLVEDPIRQLNLSPEQRERIRAIRQQLQAERTVIGQRLSEANQALDKALDADNPDEILVEQRLREVAAAQAAAMRLRVLSEVRIRRVLTLDQLLTLRTLREKARLFRRERQRENMEMRRQERVDRQRGPSNRRNGLRPALPGTTLERQRTRP
jgi:Spy/CpxP family protein refolding chaperone